MNDLKNKICLKLKSFGFNVVGITKPKVSKDTINNYNLFLKKKYHGDMYWLENHEKSKKDPSKIWKGKRMAGRFGTDKVTVKNLTVVKIDTENNFLFLKGSVPGPKNGIIYVMK